MSIEKGEPTTIELNPFQIFDKIDDRFKHNTDNEVFTLAAIKASLKVGKRLEMDDRGIRLTETDFPVTTLPDANDAIDRFISLRSLNIEPLSILFTPNSRVGFDKAGVIHFAHTEVSFGSDDYTVRVPTNKLNVYINPDHAVSLHNKGLVKTVYGNGTEYGSEGTRPYTRYEKAEDGIYLPGEVGIVVTSDGDEQLEEWSKPETVSRATASKIGKLFFRK